MKRREFLRGAATGMLGGATTIGLGACTTTAPAQAPAQPQVEWRMATSWPEILDIINGGALTIASRVDEMTGGRFKIEVLDASQGIAPALEILDAVGEGTVEAGHTASYYYTDQHKAFAFATSVPFGLNAQQQNAWLYHGGGSELLQNLFTEFNVRYFPAGNSGVQMGGWFNKEIFTPEDLKGLKMRNPGLGGDVLRAFGVEPVMLSASEIFQALDSQEVDAAEWICPYDDERLGLHRAATYYYYPGWWEPGTTLDAYVNLNAWNQLSPEYQAIFETACRDANIDMLARYDAENPAALERLINAGVNLRSFSTRILAEAEKEAFQQYDAAAADPTFKRIYDNWRQFREQINTWHWYNELSYAGFVSRQFSP